MTLPHPFQRKKHKLKGARSSALDQARGRIVLLVTVFVLAYSIVSIRVLDLALLQGWLNTAQDPDRVAVALEEDRNTDSGRADPVRADPVRADIVDRNGRLMATTLDTASLYADPARILEPVRVANGLVALFPELDRARVLERLQADKRFVWIKRHITPQDQEAVLDLGSPGLGFREEQRRFYPQGALAAHILGYAGVENEGLAGVERSFDKDLRAKGQPLRLSLDIRVQHILKRELDRALNSYSGKGGAGIVMDVRSGEVLAAVSAPVFNPHKPGKADPEALFNRTTLGVYELGSTFKIFSTAALLELTDAKMEDEFDVREPLHRAGFTINDFHAEKRILTLPEVFMVSSNIGSALIGEKVGGDRLRRFYADLGLMDPSPVNLAGVGRPLIPEPWRKINTLTAAYGHGIAVSPMQLVTAVATVVNGGFMVRPRLQPADDRTRGGERAALRVLSDRTSRQMRRLMRLAVEQGTGSHADIPGYAVAGKTGTAEKSGEDGYSRERLISSFIGVFPADEPRYAVFIMVDEPRGTKDSFGYATGGWVAAPAVGRVIKAMGPIMGLPLRQKRQASYAAGLQKYIHLSAGEEGERP